MEYLYYIGQALLYILAILGCGTLYFLMFPNKSLVTRTPEYIFTTDEWTRERWEEIKSCRQDVVHGLRLYVTDSSGFDEDSGLYTYTIYTPWHEVFQLQTPDAMGVYVGLEMMMGPISIEYSEHGSVIRLFELDENAANNHNPKL